MRASPYIHVVDLLSINTLRLSGTTFLCCGRVVALKGLNFHQRTGEAYVSPSSAFVFEWCHLLKEFRTKVLELLGSFQIFRMAFAAIIELLS